MDACRALSGKAEQQLLHKESVYKPSPHLNPGRTNYQLLVGRGRLAHRQHARTRPRRGVRAASWTNVSVTRLCVPMRAHVR